MCSGLWGGALRDDTKNGSVADYKTNQQNEKNLHYNWYPNTL